MGEWKAPLSLRIKPSLRTEIENFAVREGRSLGNLGGLLVEWGFEQLKNAGSTGRLLKFKIKPRQPKA